VSRDVSSHFRTVRSAPSREYVFQVEQYLLATQSPGVAGESAVVSDDPMTRDEDAEPITSHRGADGPRRRAVSELIGQVAVGGRLSVADLADQIPHPPLQVSAPWAEAKVEVLTLTPEVLAELAADLLEPHVGAGPEGRPVVEVPSSARPRWAWASRPSQYLGPVREVEVDHNVVLGNHRELT
jgi:hypothetical protein